MNSSAESLLYQLPSIVDRMELGAVFPHVQPIEVELGSGDGSFLVDYAARHPNRNFLGIERLSGRLRKLDKKGRRRGLENLRGLRVESGYFLQYLLPPRSVSAFHIYFPDPWPKKRHRHHRLVNQDFPSLASGCLQPGGRVYLRTDDQDYFAQMKLVFGAARDRFNWVETPVDLANISTDFERQFNAEGIPTLIAAYELRA
jgi:tRNA (guanine-N7-)-methyltransferase